MDSKKGRAESRIRGQLRRGKKKYVHWDLSKMKLSQVANDQLLK